MPTPTSIQCEYQIPVVGSVAVAPLGALAAAAPVDFQPLEENGLLLVSDVTTAASSPVTRVLVAQFLPNADATATLSLVPGDNPSGSPVQSLELAGGGDGYAAPPIVRFKRPDGSLVPNIGTPPKAHALMGASSVVVLQPGSGYTSAVTAKFVGGQLATGGTPATAGAITLAGGAITGVAVATPGGPYNVPPHLEFTDAPGGGSGAMALAGLQVTSVVLDSAGVDLTLDPNLVFVPAFLVQVKDPESVSDPLLQAQLRETQKSILRGWMKAIIAKAARTPVIEIAPILIP